MHALSAFEQVKLQEERDRLATIEAIDVVLLANHAETITQLKAERDRLQEQLTTSQAMIEKSAKIVLECFSGCEDGTFYIWGVDFERLKDLIDLDTSALDAIRQQDAEWFLGFSSRNDGGLASCNFNKLAEGL